MEQSSLAPIFQQVYAQSEWGKGSGPGSSPENTIDYRAFIGHFIAANFVRTVTDLGCGDWQFSYLLDWSKVSYVGYDVVCELVAENRKRFGSSTVRFEEFSSIESLPGGDLLLCKEVLQHLPNATILEYVAAIRAKYRFILFTNSIEPANLANADIAPGGYRPLRLQDEPFLVPGAVVLTYFVRADGGFTFTNTVYLVRGTP